MSNVRFGCTALAGTNKAGVVKPDADGYYSMVIGGLDMYNSAGEYYSLAGSKALFENSSQFMRRVKNGALRGEVGHPRMERGMSDDDFIGRIMEIRESNVCVHFKEIWLDFNNVKDQSGKTHVAIMAKLTPSGVGGAALEKALNNPGENVCFSIRAFTQNYYNGRVLTKDLKNIITFDWVNEPGIHIATKYHNPGLEQLSESTVLASQLKRVCDKINTSAVAMESSKQIAKELITAMGIDLPRGVTPAYVGW